MFNKSVISSVLSLGCAAVFTLSGGTTSSSFEAITPSEAKSLEVPALVAEVPVALRPLMSTFGAKAKAKTANPLFPAFIGNDLNNSMNPFVQPQDPALAGGGRDQTLQFHDLVQGLPFDISVLVGRLGEDILVGGANVDFIIGGPEHFNPKNRDKAFGFSGDDVFIWSPGDGSDRFDGGHGDDTIIFGLLGEDDGSGNPTFGVSTDQLAGDVFLDALGLPIVDVTNSPGFCQVIDSSSSANAGTELSNLGISHIAQFLIRGINQSFVNGTQNTDNGLRVSLHLSTIEYLVCTDPNGGAIQAFDLRTSPPTQIPVTALPFAVQFIIR